MNLFNGKLILSSVKDAGNDTPVSNWTIEAKFTSINGFHLTDVAVGDIVFFNGYAVGDGTSQICRYIVTATGTTTDGKQLSATIKYDETFSSTTTIYAPYVDDEHKTGMIGRMSSTNGFTNLPTNLDGFGLNDIEVARNIDLKNRDEKLIVYIKDQITTAVANAGSGSDKLPIAGGEITGNLKVDGTTTLTSTSIENGNNKVTLNSDGLTIAISADNPVYQKSINSVNTVNVTDVKTSTKADIKDTETLNGVNVTKQLNATGTTKSTVGTLVNGATTSEYIVNANGLNSDIEFNSNGTTSAKIALASAGDAGEIDLTATKVKLNGSVVGSNNISAVKLYQTDTGTTFEDKQLITEEHMKSYVTTYVDKKVSGATDTSALQSQIALKANSADVYTQVQVDALVQTIKASQIVTDTTHRFITDEEITVWNGKQDAIGYVPENSTKKGVANGYVPLNDDTKINPQYLPTIVVARNTVVVMAQTDFDSKLALNSITEDLVIVVPSLDRTQIGAQNIINGYKLYYINTYTASDEAADATHKVGTQTAYIIGKYDSSIITVDWAGIGNKPSNLVYLNTSNVLDDTVLPTVGTAGTYNSVTVDKYGRVTAGTAGSSSGGSGTSMKWYTSTDGNIMWYGTGDGITVAYGTNLVTITVPAGVLYTTATFKLPSQYVTATVVSVVYDKDHAFTSTKQFFNNDTEVFNLSPMPTVACYKLDAGIFTLGAGNTIITDNNKLNIGALTATTDYVVTMRF